MTLSSIELFAGAGGMALGLEKAGFQPLALLDIDKDSCQTLAKNRPAWNIINEDISKISSKNLTDYFGIMPGELDLLSGGPPCQSFSYAGKREGINDVRGTMFFHYVAFLQKLQPKAFLFENVRGLLTHDNGKTYETITKALQFAGYDLHTKCLNAWNFNVCQKRERVFVIGIRNDLKNTICFDFPHECDRKLVLKDVLKNVPESPGATYPVNKKNLFEKIPPGGNWRNLPEKEAREYMKSYWSSSGGSTGILRRMSLDEPMMTVLASPAQKLTERCHPTETRPFTVRENARCQSFPDDWMFCGSMSSQYRQIGNAVPVELAHSIGICLYKSLTEADHDSDAVKYMKTNEGIYDSC